MKLFHYVKRKKGPRKMDLLRKNFSTYVQDLRLQGFSRNTVDAYLHYVGRFFQFIKKEPKYVTAADIKRYLLKLLDGKNKERTINLAISALKSYFRDFLGKQLFRNIKRSKVPKNLPRVLSKEEIQLMIDKTKSEKHKLLIRVLYETGIRVGECVMIKVDHIHEIAKLLFVYQGKGKKDRYVPLPEGLYHEIVQYLASRKVASEYLFANSYCDHLSIRTAQEVVKQAARRAGIKMRVYPHIMRSSFATHMLQYGVPIGKIQKLMGHAYRDTTEGYTLLPHDYHIEGIPALLG